MSILKSSAEDLTLNADGSGNDIIFQSNGSTVATLDQAGTLTATTFTGAATDSTKLPTAGGTLTGTVTIDQDTDNRALVIDSESTTESAIVMYSKLGIVSMQDISGGRAAHFTRNLDEAGSYPLVKIVDDHTSNTQTALKIQQDGTGHGIDMTTAKRGIQVTGGGTDDAAAWFLNSSCETGSGSALQVYSNSAHTGTRNVCKIHNDHASSIGTTALYVKQDSTGAAARFESAGSTNIVAKSTNGNGGYYNFQGLASNGTQTFGVNHNGTIYTTSGLAVGGTGTANTLDDYEEGTWTPTVVCSTSGSYVVDTGANTLAYTKIGRVVHIQGSCGVASESSPNGNIRMSLPFTPFTGTDDTDYCLGNAILTNHGGSLPNNANMFMYGGGNFASLFSVADDGTTQYIDHNDVDTSFGIMFSMTYIAT